ncbi:MAG: holo-ACP synthase [Candidatus Omnitrophota bacterium]
MQISTGIDIVDIQRLRRAVKRWGRLFLERVFTDKEIDYAKNRRFTYEHLAGRFAAKEAILKATEVGEFAFRDIEIGNDGAGKPFANIKSPKSREYAISLSISHIKDYAVASAVVTKRGQ